MSDTVLYITIVIVCLFCSVLAAGIRDMGRDDCEKNLPRTQECVKVWVPKEGAAK